VIFLRNAWLVINIRTTSAYSGAGEMIIGTGCVCYQGSGEFHFRPEEEARGHNWGDFRAQCTTGKNYHGRRVLGSAVRVMRPGATPSRRQEAADRPVTDRSTHKLQAHQPCWICGHWERPGCIAGSVGRKREWFGQYTGSSHSQRQICSRNETTINQDMITTVNRTGCLDAVIQDFWMRSSILAEWMASSRISRWIHPRFLDGLTETSRKAVSSSPLQHCDNKLDSDLQRPMNMWFA